MTQRVYLHVGGPKSGTTYIQQVLEHNAATLADAGVLVVGARALELIHAAMVVREDPRLDDLPTAARDAWDRLVEQVREWRGASAILSYELFAGASAEQVRTALARPRRDRGARRDHRPRPRQGLASAWQERLKFALTTPLERWRPPPERPASAPSGAGAPWTRPAWPRAGAPTCRPSASTS